MICERYFGLLKLRGVYNIFAFFCFNGHLEVNIYISMVEVFERQLSNILYVHDTTTHVSVIYIKEEA